MKQPTPNLGLKRNILGIGPNAEAALAENFEKIDIAIGAGGGGSDPVTLDSLILGEIPRDTEEDIIREGDTAFEAFSKLQTQISSLITQINDLTMRLDALENPG